MRRLAILCVLVTMCMVPGCSRSGDELPPGVVVEKKSHFFFGITNLRMFFKDSLIASAYHGKTRYQTFRLGVPASPYNGKPHLLVQLPDGSVVDLTSPDVVGFLASKAASRHPCTDQFFDHIELVKHSWPAGSEQLFFSPYTFYVNNQTLLGMSVTYDPTAYDYNIGEDGTKTTFPRYSMPAPRIGTTPDNMKSIPMNAEQFVAIFGKPDRIVEFFTE